MAVVVNMSLSARRWDVNPAINRTFARTALSTKPPTPLCPNDGLHRQGSLDGLCSIYATINSISLQLDKIDCTELFEVIIRHIGRRLYTFMLNGMDGPDLEKSVLAPCHAYLAAKDIDFVYSTISAKTLGSYWSIMEKHIEQHGPGSILLSISGSYNHWTCLRQITSKCITLADSGDGLRRANLDRLYRAKVTIGTPNKNRIRGLLPSETYLISATRSK